MYDMSGMTFYTFVERFPYQLTLNAYDTNEDDIG
jgi:hypothetical protein